MGLLVVVLLGLVFLGAASVNGWIVGVHSAGRRRSWSGVCRAVSSDRSVPTPVKVAKQATSSIVLGIIASSLSFSNPVASLALDAAPAVDVAIPALTAKDLITNDLQPKIDQLKDILFVIKQFPSYVEKREYTALRGTLRTEPTMGLRKACRKVQKYLSAEDAKKFNAAYVQMIDSVDKLDVTALRRTQNTGIPAKPEAPDSEMLTAIETTVRNYEVMLQTLSNAASATP